MTAPGMGAGCAVGIDLGTSNTVAILRWADGRTRPLLFDGRPVLPSAVYLDADGTIHAGRDAERMAQLDPASYDPNPKRRIDDGAVLLGGRELPVAELLAAILRAVGGPATEAVGFLPTAVLTYPASWGTPRRQTLQEAAARAGWSPPRLVPEPVAAARYFTDVMRRPVPPGATIAIFDFGGGTLDVALVRNEGTTFSVVGWGGAEDLGGLDIDAALVAHLGRQLERDQPEAWRQISRPVEEIDRRHRRQFWEDTRAAKEMLSRTSVAPIAVPGVNVSLHVTREELEELARPLVRRAVAELVTTVRRSRLRIADLSAVFLVGGASRIPLVAQLLHTELGIAPTVLEQPELPVAEGALADLLAALAPPRQPPPSRQGAPQVPSQRTASQATTGLPAAPVSGSAGTATGWTGPLTGVPVSGMPVSGMPVSGSPFAGPPTTSGTWMPVSATPVSPMAGPGAPPYPPGMRPVPPPPYPPPQPFLPRPRRRGLHPALIVVIVLAVAIAIPCGLVVYLTSQSAPGPQETFQALAQVLKIPANGMAQDAFVASYLSDTEADTVAQIGRYLDVSTANIATKTVRHQLIGDAAKWTTAMLLRDHVVALAEPENGKRKLFGVSTVDGKTWATTIGTDGTLLPGDASPGTGNAPALLWLDRQTNKMSYISSVNGQPDPHTRSLPPNWRVLTRSDNGAVTQVLVVADGAIWQVGGDKPVRVTPDRLASGTPVGRIHLSDVVTAGIGGAYQISIFSGQSRTHQFPGPPNRTPVWVDGCRQDNEICVIDQVGTDPGSREFAQYTTGGHEDWRAPVPNADVSLFPEFLGEHGESDVIVSTQAGNLLATVVLSPTGTQSRTYIGRVVGIDANRAIKADIPTVPALISVKLDGLDLDRNLSTSLGDPIIRWAGCAVSRTSLLCPGLNDFTLWRITK